MKWLLARVYANVLPTQREVPFILAPLSRYQFCLKDYLVIMLLSPYV